METILGIDLGTTNSVVSIIRDGKPEVLREDGETVLPSVVGLDVDGGLLVGKTAQNQFALAPDRTVRSIKRRMGQDETVQMGDQQYTPQEISAMILRTLRQRAEQQLGGPVTKAVITVPAFFSEQQREATREAGELAGLEVARIINEPTAAALVYDPQPEKLERLLVYDLGGGTFDVSVVQIEQGVVEVLASTGDTKLGGDDFDELLMNYVCDKFAEEHDVDLRESLSTKSRVLRAVEQAKIQLSFEGVVQIEEEFITEKAGLPLHLKMEVARHDYEDLIEPLLAKTLVCLDESLSDAKLTAGQIDKVILVGGATRTPLVHRMLEEQLGQPVHSEVDPDLCVAMGAAVQGGLIAGVDVGPVLVDITPHSLGVQCIGQLLGHRSHYKFVPIIERNTPLPASRSDVFSTSQDGQEMVIVSVYQGEHEDVRHNDLVGEFDFEGLADVERGNEVLVRFDLNLDGILKVTTTERATGLEQNLVIDNAMERFRTTNREAAQARLDEVFQSTSTIVDEADEMPEELRRVIASAEDLVAKGERIAPDVNDEDANEIRELVRRIRGAIAGRDSGEIEELLPKLEDLVFYLEDA